MGYCMECGIEMPDTAKFCPSCGFKTAMPRKDDAAAIPVVVEQPTVSPPPRVDGVVARVRIPGTSALTDLRYVDGAFVADGVGAQMPALIGARAQNGDVKWVDDDTRAWFETNFPISATSAEDADGLAAVFKPMAIVFAILAVAGMLIWFATRPPIGEAVPPNGVLVNGKEYIVIGDKSGVSTIHRGDKVEVQLDGEFATILRVVGVAGGN